MKLDYIRNKLRLEGRNSLKVAFKNKLFLLKLSFCERSTFCIFMASYSANSIRLAKVSVHCEMTSTGRCNKAKEGKRGDIGVLVEIQGLICGHAQDFNSLTPK